MNEQKIHQAVQDIETEADIVEFIKYMLKPRNRNTPCLCGSGKKYKNCCRGQHVADFKKYQEERNQ
ncbi:SEC-C metal-binding domain-containing protein [Vibrio campbellii]|uniref:SEC-C metal-binding domain-containing protein n=1 Tax=Vibrio campbellii TaxID=680 RepID=UPI001F20A2C6|nr:SEC-C metal-binding domain-containing protein [Vibrio campbellii]MCE7729646.1 SEC-C domain-containing protein [Vibrio campbellii]